MAREDEPVRLTEDEETGDRFLVYGGKDGFRLDIRYEGETLWMTQAQIAQLFGRDQSVISRHIANILEEGELDEEGNMQKMHIANSSKPITLYSLDMVISVGFQVPPEPPAIVLPIEHAQIGRGRVFCSCKL
ncbi:hypothetical protein L5876_10660 [Hyphobacterium sp. SN044]|uniref:hypothetical protein n=1 Tax=Hyphobacterium sp. SN044 TaxID=2912575 RepID=UPI001F1F8B8F|nr:hypothetical protein [Hyphobacterium sp. SN044]MCF8880276.1 hypothetical protein [Hyphobacterium sp. SN044]